MSRYQPTLIILPEDEKNKALVNGFLLQQCHRENRIQLENVSGGWTKARDQLETYSQLLRRYPNYHLLLIIDFDQNLERYQQLQNRVPDDLQDRVFFLGSFSDPESLQTSLKHSSAESIGQMLAEGCPSHFSQLWQHELLKHNLQEIERIVSKTKGFLFA